ncbi:hypothetical protein NB012_002481, partial [Citrobacter freundii]
MQAFTAGLSGGFFICKSGKRYHERDLGKKMAPCAATQQGAGSVQDYLRSSIIPSVAKIRG